MKYRKERGIMYSQVATSTFDQLPKPKQIEIDKTLHEIDRCEVGSVVDFPKVKKLTPAHGLYQLKLSEGIRVLFGYTADDVIVVHDILEKGGSFDEGFRGIR